MNQNNNYKNELNKLEKQGLKRSLLNSGLKNVINFSSNDYLGLSHHPEVKKSVQDFLSVSNVGGTSSRLLAGTSNIHHELENDLAHFLSKEKALVYSSGYHVNTGVLPVLAKEGDIIFVDRLCHASILDGIRLSKARFCTFDHNNPDHLEGLLQKRRNTYSQAFIVTEGIFSMDGDRGMLQEIIFLAKKWNAQVYLDEAHSLGVFGPEGKGLAAQLNLLKDVDIFVGTLSKSLGSQGGFVAGAKDLIDLLISRSRSFIYTTALSPLSARSARTALKLLPKLDKERKQILDGAGSCRVELKKMGFDTLQSESQIIPVLTGSVSETKKLSDYLLSVGFFVPSIRPPTVPENQGRVRLSMVYDEIDKGVEKLIHAFSNYSEIKMGAEQKIVKVQ